MAMRCWGVVKWEVANMSYGQWNGALKLTDFPATAAKMSLKRMEKQQKVRE